MIIPAALNRVRSTGHAFEIFAPMLAMFLAFCTVLIARVKIVAIGTEGDTFAFGDIVLHLADIFSAAGRSLPVSVFTEELILPIACIVAVMVGFVTECAVF